MIKKILPFILIISFSYPSSMFIEETSTEYSVGLSDKTTYYGIISKDWIKETDYGESYITAGFIGFTGSYGYGRRYYLSKRTFLSPHVSLTGFGYYLLGIGGIAGLAVSANLGIDVFTIKWKKNEFKFQFGLFTGYDPINGKSILIPADDGPSWLMPSFNIKARFLK
tara:strand:+ start:259 stop:759 length:501 start_codon:yes stop_codon:yes gene_type:complete